MAAPRLRATESGQVYNIDLPELKVTRDDVDGIYVLHGRGYFQTFTSRDEAFERKKEIDYSTFR
jgi:hypothetical protein